MSSAQAARLRPGDVALRSQAIGALAIPDFREIRRRPAQHRDDGTPLRQAMAPAMDRYASIMPDDSIAIRRTSGGGGGIEHPPAQPGPPDWLEFSPDGRYLVALSMQLATDAVIWDTATGAERLRVPAAMVKSAYGVIRFRETLPEVVMLQGNSVRILPLDGSASRSIPLPSHKDLLTGEFSGRVLAGSRTNGRAYLVNLSAGSVESTLPAFASSFAFGLSPDARTTAVSSDGLVTLHDLTNSGIETAQMPGKQGPVPLLVFETPAARFSSPAVGMGPQSCLDAQIAPCLAAIPLPSSCRFTSDGMAGWPARTAGRWISWNREWAGRESCRVLRMAANDLSNRMVFGAAGRLLLSTGDDGVQVSDAATLRMLLTLPSPTVRECVMPGPSGPLYVASTGGLFRRTVRQQDGHFVFGDAELLLPGDAWSVAASADGATIAAMAGRGIFVSANGGELTPVMPAPEQYRTMSLSPDGRWLALRGARLLVLDLSNPELASRRPSGRAQAPR